MSTRRRDHYVASSGQVVEACLEISSQLRRIEEKAQLVVSGIGAAYLWRESLLRSRHGAEAKDVKSDTAALMHAEYEMRHPILTLSVSSGRHSLLEQVLGVERRGSSTSSHGTSETKIPKVATFRLDRTSGTSGIIRFDLVDPPFTAEEASQSTLPFDPQHDHCIITPEPCALLADALETFCVFEYSPLHQHARDAILIFHAIILHSEGSIALSRDRFRRYLDGHWTADRIADLTHWIGENVSEAYVADSDSFGPFTVALEHFEGYLSPRARSPQLRMRGLMAAPTRQRNTPRRRLASPAALNQTPAAVDTCPSLERGA
ncbi:hypothetical protein JCM10212_005097 [Sporobolomyces blumeae]